MSTQSSVAFAAPVKTIVVPMDFSEPAKAAFDYAIRLATDLGGAEIILLHAFEIPDVGFPDARVGLAEDFRKRILEEIDGNLNHVLSAHQDNKAVPVRLCIEQGSALDVTLDVAEREHANLIITGTHGRHGLSRALLGSMAEQLVRSSPIPVLTVHAPPLSEHEPPAVDNTYP